MTMPTRPAPAPPHSKGHNAATNANITLQQLHLLQQRQQQQDLEQRPQHYNVTVPKLTIKLPPPPIKGQNSIKHNHRNNRNNNVENNIVSNNEIKGNLLISQREISHARYTPATDWNDIPFENFTSNNNSIHKVHKKIPPPRPPPPRCNNVNGSSISKNIPTPITAIQQSTNVLNNLFHRKKSTITCNRSVIQNSAASRIYNSAAYGSTRNEMKQTKFQQGYKQQLQQNTITTTNWDSAWSIPANASISQTKEPQLISFDSPPSSPTFTQKSNSDCLSVDSFSSDSNFSSPNYGSASQPESGFEDDFNNAGRSRPATTSPRDPWDSVGALTTKSGDMLSSTGTTTAESRYGIISCGHVRNLNVINARINSSDDNPLCNGKSLLPPTPPLNVPTIIKPKISQKPMAPKPPTPVQQTAKNNINGIHKEISILDVITGKIDALELDPSNVSDTTNVMLTQPYGISTYAFDGTEDGDLSFKENEKIYLLEQVNADWLKGRTRSGCEGIFPSNYIDIKVPLQTNTTIEHKNQIFSDSTSNITQTANTIQAKCLYNFPAEVDGDLELKENDIVTILYRINADWLFGELNGRQGQFPENFLESVPSNIPTL